MAQIVTITNPLTGQPAQVDQLEHTAQEIDDAIARALPGGAIDITLQNKAPSGYGYDGANSSLLLLNFISGDTVDDKLTTLFNSMVNASAVQICLSDTSFSGYEMHGTLYKLSNYHGGYATAVFNGYDNYSGIPVTVRKVLREGVWGPYEYFTPPMYIGKEYRTTERHNGGTVFAKAMTYTFTSSYDSASQFGLEIPHKISNFGSLVRAEAVSPPYMIPYVSQNGGFAGVRAVNATNILFDSYKTSWSSGNKIMFKLFYTKS